LREHLALWAASVIVAPLASSARTRCTFDGASLFAVQIVVAICKVTLWLCAAVVNRALKVVNKRPAVRNAPPGSHSKGVRTKAYKKL
jgi:hypothetical protein